VRQQPVHVTLLDASEVVTHFQRTLARALRTDVRLRCELQPDSLVELDRTQLEQVLMNLSLNARDAMPSGGRLTISCGPGPDGSTRLAVSDTGQGMSSEVRARLFEPFFTTKEPGRGTGLGLATVHAIVTAARGRIEVTSAPGLGTTVELFFPRPEGVQRQEPRSLATPVPQPVRGGKLMVVDDDSLVRVLLARALKREGFAVLEASSAVEALAQLTDDVALVLTDVVMPEMSGTALAQSLRATRPGLPVLFFSGGLDVPPDVTAAGGRSDFLPKPFSTHELLRRVRALLAE
jgi:CheY-like chemotaxis protein